MQIEQIKKYLRNLVGATLVAGSLALGGCSGNVDLPIDKETKQEIINEANKRKQVKNEEKEKRRTEFYKREEILFEPLIKQYLVRLDYSHELFANSLKDGKLSIPEQREIYAAINSAVDSRWECLKRLQYYSTITGMPEFLSRYGQRYSNGRTSSIINLDPRLTFPNEYSNLEGLLASNLSGIDFGTPEVKKALEKQGRFSLLGHVMNAFRRETNQYLESEGEYREIPDSQYQKPNDGLRRIARRLDPAGRYFEDAGDLEAAKESRIAQAEALTSRGNKNYGSAAILYEQVGDYKKAVENYQALLADKDNRPWNSDMTLETKSNIFRLEEKIAKQKATDRKKSASLATLMIGIAGSFMFFSANITGNAIANISSTTSSLIGSALLTLGIMAGFFYIKLRREVK
jgi:tetratricopeptide (TPR) repeat protein